MKPFIELPRGIRIATYGPTFAIGFLIAVIIAVLICERYELPKDDAFQGALFGLVGLIIGAKLVYFISKWPIIIQNFSKFIDATKKYPLSSLDYCFGGMVFYGGLIGAVAGVYVYCRAFHVKFTPFLDVYAPLLPFVHAFGRIGCFLGGCCYGKEYHGFGSVKFPYNEMVPELSEVPRVPVQLIEAAANMIFFIILFLIMKNKKMKQGRAMGIYILYYTIARYCLEYLRGDEVRGSVGFLSISQIISIILFPIAIVLIRGKFIERKTQDF